MEITKQDKGAFKKDQIRDLSKTLREAIEKAD